MKNQDCVVGVVVPVFGELNQIKACIRSLDAQTRPWEFKVAVLDAVDDKDIKRFLEEHEDWLIIENDEPRGIIQSTELGIEACKSKFVALVDCDDVLHSKSVETIEEVLRAENSDTLGLVSFRYKRSSDIDNYWEKWSKEEVEIDHSDVRSDSVNRYSSESQLLLDHALASHLKVYRKDLMQKVSEEYHGVQDAVASHLVSLQGKVLFRPELLYLHRIHSGQTSSIQEVAQIRKINRYRTNYLQRGLASSSRCTAIEKLIPWFGKAAGNLGNSVFIVLRDDQVLLVDFLTFSKWTSVYPRLKRNDSVLFSVNEWFDFGALAGFAEVGSPFNLILDQTSSPLDDVAKWYGGYFDAVLLNSKLDSTILSQFLPLQLLLTIDKTSIGPLNL